MILLPFQLGGRFRVGARRPDGRLRPLADWQDNLILDAGLDMVATTNTYLDAVQAGTSGVAPTVEHTALLEPVAGTANRVSANSAASGFAPWRGQSQITYRFPTGAVTGLIRELAVAPGATPGSPAFSRVILRNAVGKPAGVAPLADEALEVEYELSIYAPPNDVSGTTNIDGTSHGYTARASLASTTMHWAPYDAASFGSSGQAAQASFSNTPGAHAVAYSGAIGSITSSPGGTAVNASGVGQQPYVPGSHERRVRLFWDLDVANFGGIRSLSLRMAPGSGAGGNSLGAYQVEFSPVAPKTSELGFFFDLGADRTP